MADKQPMDDQTVMAICAAEIRGAVGLPTSTVSRDREQAMRYFLGEKFGNEQEGRSQVVMTEVRDVIQAMLPDLLEIFAASTNLGTCLPRGPEDEAAAAQATDAVNYVFTEQNKGFLLLYQWFLDALMQKVGFVKASWDRSASVVEEHYSGLTGDQLALLVADDDVEVLEHSQQSLTTGIQGTSLLGMSAAAGGASLHDVRIRRTNRKGRVALDNVPPEEMRISGSAKTIEDSPFVGHVFSRPRSYFVAMGYDREVIDQLPIDDATEWGTEATARRGADNAFGSAADQSIDPSMQRVTVCEGYYRIDCDGDGIAELRQIVTGASGSPILTRAGKPANVVFSGPRPPFYSLCPYIIPHRFFGLSAADMTMDLQEVKSTVVRQLLDNMYNVNNARNKVILASDDGVSLDDLLTNRPGGIVRVRLGSDVVPMETAPLGNFAFPLVEYLDGVRENRTGVTRYNQGLDADSLNKTARGVQMIQNSGQKRLLLIARLFAETGVRDLFNGILQLLQENQDVAMTVRLRGKWVTVDPRTWATGMDVKIGVGLGSGTAPEQIGILNQLLDLQVKALGMGLDGVLVGLPQIYATLNRMVEVAGLRNPEEFWIDPRSPQPPSMPQKPPQPDPAQQAAMAKLQLDQQRAQADIQLAREKAAADMEIRRTEAAGRMELERAKMQGNMALATQELQAEVQLKHLDLITKGAPVVPNIPAQEI
jgi:hypothetical protein